MRTSRGNASGLSGVDEKKRRMRNVVGPTTSSVLTICSRNPVTIDAIAMTVAIPMTTPRMVSPERSLLIRSWSSAITQPSRMEWRAMLLGAQRFDRVEARRPQRGVDAEHDADDHAHAQRQDHGPQRHARRQRGGDLDQRGEGSSGEQTGAAAQHREHDRLGQELAPDVASRGAERLADPDLPRALRDAHHHDVHDDDAAAQNAINPSPVSTVKSSSSPGRSRCAMRIASSARSMPSATPAAAAILTEITLVWRRPYRASKVESGSMTNPSQDCPSTVPFFAMTPLMVSCAPRTRMVLPTASSGAPNSFSATSKPSTATSLRCRWSTSVNGAPAAKA